MKNSPPNTAQSQQEQERPKLVRGPDPKLYLPAMPPLWLLDHLDYYLRLAWWKFNRQKPIRKTLIYSSVGLVIALVIIACGDRQALSERCPASRIQELAADLEPRANRLLDAYRRHQCNALPRSRDTESSVETTKADSLIRGRCERLTSQLRSLLNSVEGYLLLDSRRNACFDGARGITALPDKLRRTFEDVKSELDRTVERSPSLFSAPKWMGNNFCRAC